MPEAWEWCRLNSIATFELGKTLDTAKNTGTYKPYLRSVNVRWNSIDLNDINCMKFEPDELARYSIKKGDLLICEGGDVGRSCVWEKNEEMYYQNALHRVRFYMNINPYFYMYIMMYYANSGKLQEICKGVTIKHLTRTTLLTLLFPLPPQNESLNIINKILEFDSLLQNLEENKNDISYLISCAKSKILDLAIRGQLVPQNPDDEPASVLLERIRTEKEELIKQGKIKRDKKASIIFRGDDNSYYEKIGDDIENIDTEIPFNLPENWIWCRGCSCFSGMESTKPQGEFFDYIDIDSIDNKLHCIKKTKHIPVIEAPSRASRAINSGSVLFSLVRPYLENIALIEEIHSHSIASTGFYICNSNGLLLPEYMFYLMISKYVVDGLNQYMKGDNSPSISKNDIENWLYPIPPIEEQRRICYILKSTFTTISKLEESLI